MAIIDNIDFYVDGDVVNAENTSRPIRQLITMLDEGTVALSADKLLEFNKSILDTDTPLDNIEIVVNRGNETDAKIRWNETTDSWEFSDGNGNYSSLGDKVNVDDIVNNLTTTSANQPLSANQGKVLKDLIDSSESDITYTTMTIEDIQAIWDNIIITDKNNPFGDNSLIELWELYSSLDNYVTSNTALVNGSYVFEDSSIKADINDVMLETSVLDTSVDFSISYYAKGNMCLSNDEDNVSWSSISLMKDVNGDNYIIKARTESGSDTILDETFPLTISDTVFDMITITKTSDNLKIYKNDVLLQDYTLNNTIYNPSQKINFFDAENDHTLPSQQVNLKNVRFFNKAISLDEINILINNDNL